MLSQERAQIYKAESINNASLVSLGWGPFFLAPREMAFELT